MTEELLLEIEVETGFTCYDSCAAGNIRFTFYGTSVKFNQFKTLIGDKARTGFTAFLIDTKEVKFYDVLTGTWM